MYKITWDKETGGVLLHSRIVDGTLGTISNRVYYQKGFAKCFEIVSI